MATHSMNQEELDDRPSGVPAPGKLGASRNELYALLIALAVIVAIAAAFWLESRP